MRSVSGIFNSKVTAEQYLRLNVRKITFGHVRPAKIQISLRICAGWSESSLGAFWIAKDAKFLPVDNEDSDQTVRMCRLIWVLVGRIFQKVLFHTLWLISLVYDNNNLIIRVSIRKLWWPLILSQKYFTNCVIVASSPSLGCRIV